MSDGFTREQRIEIVAREQYEAEGGTWECLGNKSDVIARIAKVIDAYEAFDGKVIYEFTDYGCETTFVPGRHPDAGEQMPGGRA